MNIIDFLTNFFLPTQVGLMRVFKLSFFSLSTFVLLIPNISAATDAEKPVFFYLAPKRDDLIRHMQDIETKLRTKTKHPFLMKFVEFHGKTQEMSLESIASVLSGLAKQMPLAIISPNLDIAKAAVKYRIPVQVVISSLADPVGHGVVRSLANQNEDITGYTFAVDQIDEKRMSLLKEIAPRTKKIGILMDDIIKQQRLVRQQGQFAYMVDGVEVIPFVANNVDSAVKIIEMSHQQKIDAWYIRLMIPNFDDAAKKIMIDAVNLQKLPSMYETKRFVELGGLAAYQVVIIDQLDNWSRSLELLLEGVRARDIPIERPRHFIFSLNTVSSERLRLNLPPAILRRIDVQYPCVVQRSTDCNMAMPKQN
jgi:putative tryptophan/tyrosine transport system substrate-binding protein